MQKKGRPGQVNIEKWKRDRTLDRSFLYSGIPVWRVWDEEVKNNPYAIMGTIMSFFNSLGGQRMQYR